MIGNNVQMHHPKSDIDMLHAQCTIILSVFYILTWILNILPIFNILYFKLI